MTQINPTLIERADEAFFRAAQEDKTVGEATLAALTAAIGLPVCDLQALYEAHEEAQRCFNYGKPIAQTPLRIILDSSKAYAALFADGADQSAGVTMLEYKEDAMDLIKSWADKINPPQPAPKENCDCKTDDHGNIFMCADCSSKEMLDMLEPKQAGA